MKLPHHNVYARIGRSSIHGVGVIAIRQIQKGCSIFSDDDQNLRWIKAQVVRRQPKEIRKLYNDFGVQKKGKYGCPKNFNLLTPAWYLNHSDNPNVAADKSYRFFALRVIKKGEELLVDYRTYSD